MTVQLEFVENRKVLLQYPCSTELLYSLSPSLEQLGSVFEKNRLNNILILLIYINHIHNL